MAVRAATVLALLTSLVATSSDADVLPRQDAGLDSVFRSGVEVVRGRIILNGRNGRAPKTLVPDDVEIRQNGERQTITVFEAFVLSPTRTCYEIGFSSSTPAGVKTRTVEVKVQGYSKRLKSTYTVREESSPPEGGHRPRKTSSCR